MILQAFNPYLPSWEYIPDGEPHIFGDRVYVYGSHDKFGGNAFCMNDYVTWSAPLNNLADWRYEGVIYKKTDDPNYKGKGYMYAPDVCLAPDGKYYIYYGFSTGITRKSWAIRCAVADSPTGPFKYVGEVKLYPYSKKFLPFDPAVYVEGGRVWLYYGSAMFFPVFGVSAKNVCGAVVELDPADMITPLAPPKVTLPCRDKSLGGHGFFEASSMRKIGGRYYFVYSSLIGHELCYAVGKNPDGPFTFGGTLVSNGDIGLKNHKAPKTASNFTGNTHGGMLELDGKYYVFYHRHTNGQCCSRQGCAEEIFIEADGSIKQAEITSCGLNGKPLAGEGEYESRIACNLTAKSGGKFYRMAAKLPVGNRPYFTQSGADRIGDPDQYIANFCGGSSAGFKYFSVQKLQRIGVKIKGNARGVFSVSDESGKTVAEIPVSPTEKPTAFYGDYTGEDGKKAFHFTFNGKGRCDFLSILLAK